MPYDIATETDAEPEYELKDRFDLSPTAEGSRIYHTLANLNRACSPFRLNDFFPYETKFVRRLLHNKHVLIIGDSLSRAIYKDLISLLVCDEPMQGRLLKKKTEPSHLGDRQIDMLPLECDRVFRQAREYQSDDVLLQYLFTTRAMKDDVERALLQLVKRKEFPDVLIINSALWDLTRYNVCNVYMGNVEPYSDCPWGQIENEMVGMEEYLERISMLMRRLRLILPPYTQVVWLCMPYPMPDGSSGMMTRVGTSDKRLLHRSVYCDGNYRAAQVVRSAGYDVLDLGFYMRNHSLYCYRIHDGVHWDSAGTRMMTQLLIGHLAKNVNLNNTTESRLNTYCPTLKDEGSTFLTAINKNLHPLPDNDGSYSEPLQLELRDKSMDLFPLNVSDAIKGDIAHMRALELLRQHKLAVTDEFVAEVETQTRDGPLVCRSPAAIFPFPCPLQRIVMKRRDRADTNGASSEYRDESPR